MSDVGTLSGITLLNGARTNPRMNIESIINSKFFADYGFVDQINTDKTVNVIHSIKSVLIDGTELPAIQSKNIQVIFPASASFGVKWPIALGDCMLLIGLRDVVTDVETANQATSPSEFWHYEQNTLIAIPLGLVASPSITLTIDDSGNLKIVNNNASGNIQLQTQAGLFQIKNAAKSLYTLLNTLEGALATANGAAAQASIAAGAASSASLAAAIEALMVAFTAATATMQADLALLLEA